MGRFSNKKKGRPIPIVPPKMKSLKRARHVTTEFHRITHAIDELERKHGRQSGKANSEDTRETSAARLASLKDELAALGGRAAYQEASVRANARSFVYSP